MLDSSLLPDVNKNTIVMPKARGCSTDNIVPSLFEMVHTFLFNLWIVSFMSLSQTIREEFQRPIVISIIQSKTDNMQKELGCCHMENITKCLCLIRFIKLWVVSNK